MCFQPVINYGIYYVLSFINQFHRMLSRAVCGFDGWCRCNFNLKNILI